MRYRKKPVVIEAYRPYEGEMPEWFEKALCEKTVQEHTCGGFNVVTLEGIHYAHPGDYIIKGIAGELYPCKPDIFEHTYEAAE